MEKAEKKIDLKNFILKSIDKSNLIFRKNLNQCRKLYTEPGIHDFRVSIRRMTSFLFLLSNFSDVPYLDELQKTLKKILKSLNPVRDSQVEVLMLKNLIFKFPVLYTFYIHLLNQELALAEKAAKIIEETDIEGIDSLIFFLKLHIKEKFEYIGFSIDKLNEIKKSAYDDLINKYSYASIVDPESIHKVRLALKKFRYIEEAIKPLNKLPKAKLKKMKSLQDLLGEIQDYTVIIDRISSFTISQRVIPLNKYNDAMKFLDSYRADLISNFFDKREENIAALT
jgi:CHAD domain-containing protein